MFRGDKVLLVRRGQPPAQETWVPPGGLLEVGETIEEALAREIQEETGWSVRVLELIELFDYMDRDASGRVRYHYILADYLCEYLDGELQAGSDVMEARLVPLSELPRYRLTPKVLDIIEKAKRKAERRGQFTE